LFQELQGFRDIARERESIGNLLTAHKVESKRLLQSTFLSWSVSAISTQVMLDFIPEFPSARLVKTVKPRTIQKALQRKGVDTRLTTYTAEELILQGKVRTLQHLLQRQNELTKVLTEYCKSAMLEDFKIVTSINGISKCTATTFLAEIGCIGNYASHKKLIAFAGIDPTVYQSGKFEAQQNIEAWKKAS
jgi:hypothetical protein